MLGQLDLRRHLSVGLFSIKLRAGVSREASRKRGLEWGSEECGRVNWTKERSLSPGDI